MTVLDGQQRAQLADGEAQAFALAAIDTVFIEDVMRQAERLRLHRGDTETASSWINRVRKAALIDAVTGEREHLP